MNDLLTGVPLGSGYSTGDSLSAGAVVGAAAQRHADHAAGERHEHGVMVPIQLQAQDLPPLPTDVASEDDRKRQRAEVGSVDLEEEERNWEGIYKLTTTKKSTPAAAGGGG